MGATTATAETSASSMSMLLPDNFLKEREVEPVGRWFLNHWSRVCSGRGFSQRLTEPGLDETVEEEEAGDEFDDDVEYLKKIDIKDKKKQDYYRILGLTKQRIFATDDLIKKAHKQKVLKHHPDKRKAAGEEVKAEDYFSCITTAFEILMNPERRRAFDSVDPTFDDAVPNILKQKTLTTEINGTQLTEEEIKQKVLKHHKAKSSGEKRKPLSLGDKKKLGGDPKKTAKEKKKTAGEKKKSNEDKKFDDDLEYLRKAEEDAMPKETKDDDFYSIFGPVFEKNSRWSDKTPVPILGNTETTHEEADAFYSYWYSFESWREYSMLDEEDTAQAENRMERREIEKLNKNQRNKMKADETKRIFKLVDNAYKSDPRIAKFKEDEKNEKIAKKQAKIDQVQALKDEEGRVVREKVESEKKEREAKEELEKAKKAAEKKEKEQRKKALKLEQKRLRNLAKEDNYFCEDEDEKLRNIVEIEKMCEMYSQMQLKELVDKLDQDKSVARQVFLEELHKLNPELANTQIQEEEEVEEKIEASEEKEEAIQASEEVEEKIEASEEKEEEKIQVSEVEEKIEASEEEEIQASEEVEE